MKKLWRIGQIVVGAGIVLFIGYAAICYLYFRPPAPVTELLWQAGAPDALGSDSEDKPSIQVFLPPARTATGSGVIICPGGAYIVLKQTPEGEDIAEWLNKHGVAAFVLKYRIAPRYYHPASMNDILRAIRLVRFNKDKYGLLSNHVGVMGFSAGGHLASTAATHFDEAVLNKSDPIDAVSSRPDFAILGYPVITMLPVYAHEQSVTNLLGANPSRELRRQMSNELHVTVDTPPTFIFHTDQDQIVSAQNSILYYSALNRAGVPAELHIYERGGHGLGLARDVPGLASWPERLEDWLKERGLLERRK